MSLFLGQTYPTPGGLESRDEILYTFISRYFNSLELCRKQRSVMAKKEKTEKAGIRVKDPQKYEYAYLLYMKKVPQKDIAERVGVSQQTLVKWKDDGGWELKRVAKTVSRDQIVNKTLTRINDMLDSGEDFNADEFSKAVNQIKKLQAGCTMDDIADILTGFGDWIIEQGATDKAITTDFVRLLTRYHDKYLLMRINNG